MQYTGTENDDALFGTDESDVLYGGAGSDILDGKGGSDLIDAGDGDDLIFGGDGADSIIGGDGRDDIYAGAGNDRIKGGDNDDVLRAEEGGDRLEGGKGNDTLIGGDGHDIATFSGNVADYDFQYSYGLLTLTDKRPEAEGGEGLDYILEIERLLFADGIVFLAPNQTPVAAADSLSALEDGRLEVDAANGLLANDGDPEEDAFSVTAIEGQMANVGQSVMLASGAQVAVQADGSLVFDPLSVYNHLAAGEIVSETFSYTITDANGATATASATIHIEGQNDVPAAVDTAYGPASEDGTTQFLFAGGSDIDESATLDYVIVDTPASNRGQLHRTNDAGFAFTAGTALNGLGEGETATVSFTYRVTDEHDAQSGLRTATITVTGHNDAPIGGDAIGDQTGREGDAFLFQLGGGVFHDPDANDTLTFHATLADGGALPAWLHFDPAARRFFGTPSLQDAGVSDIVVTVTDSHGASVRSGFELTIADAAPIISDPKENEPVIVTPDPPASHVNPIVENPNIHAEAPPTDGTSQAAPVAAENDDRTIYVVQGSAEVFGSSGRDVIDARRAQYSDDPGAMLLLDGGADADTYYLGEGRDAVRFHRDPGNSDNGDIPVAGDVIHGFQPGQDQLIFLDYADGASSVSFYRLQNDVWAMTRVFADDSVATEYLQIAGSENFDLVAGRDYRFALADPQPSAADFYANVVSNLYSGSRFGLFSSIYNDIWPAGPAFTGDTVATEYLQTAGSENFDLGASDYRFA